MEKPKERRVFRPAAAVFLAEPISWFTNVPFYGALSGAASGASVAAADGEPEKLTRCGSRALAFALEARGWPCAGGQASFRHAANVAVAGRLARPERRGGIQSERGVSSRPARRRPMEVSYPGRSLGPTGRLLKGTWWWYLVQPGP